MESLFAAVNAVLSFITPVSDFFWDFPKNYLVSADTDSGKFLTGHHCAGRFRALFHIPAWIYSGTVF